jgi:predicted O-methyltransferase YrrM
MTFDVMVLIAALGLGLGLGVTAVLWRRLGRLETALEAARAEIREGQVQLQRQLRDGGEELLGQGLALVSLRDRLELHQGIPYTRHWSAGADFLELLVAHCLERRPGTLVECGSGLTSLVLARCCQRAGRGRVTSLEDGTEFARATRGHLERYGLGAFARVLEAGLQSWTLGQETYRWYALDDLPPEPIDLLVIDGPPGFLQPRARYPALPLLYHRLADGCTVFLDDAARPDERAIVERWLAELPGLEHRYLETGRGCSVLTLRRPPAQPGEAL